MISTISILILAIVVRIPLLNQSLWLDEAIEALALMGRKGPILKYAFADFQPPIYHLILKPWTEIFGYSEISLRMPSLIFSILSIYATMKIARILSNKKTSIISGLLLALNPLHIYYSAEGRTYMLTTLLATLSFYYLILCIKKHSAVALTLYGIFTTLMLWTSYLSWIVVSLQFLYLLYKKQKPILKVCILSTSSLLILTPFVFKQLQIGFSTISISPQWGRVVGGFELIRLPRTWFKFIAGRVSFENKKLYAVVMLSTFLIHLSYAKNTLKKPKTHILMLWLIPTIVIAYVISIFVPVYQYFRLLFTLPAYILVLSIGISETKHIKLNTVVVSLISILFLAYFYTTPRFHKEDWRTLTKYLNSQQDIIVAIPSLAQDAPLQYYSLKHQLIELPKTTSINKQTLYYIQYAEDLFDVKKIGIRNLSTNNYTKTSEKSFTTLKLIEYTKANN